MISFAELGVEKNILDAIEELGFVKPMPVQEEVIPQLIQKVSGDIVALAQTGTGKTAAFGLPIIQNTQTNKNHVQYLILSPTRELCVQIADDLISFSKYKKGVKVAAVFGGSSMERQIKMIKQGAQIISATPGRLLDLIKRKAVKLSKIDTVILDEADEMLNMGFRDELEAILQNTPEHKNTLLFSATMPKEVLAISKNYMHDPIEITIGKKNVGAENVKHEYYMVHAKDRYLALKRIADYYPEIYGIIFCRTRKETQEVADMLIKDGYNADSLHGDLSQAQRDNVMNKFRIKHLRLLVATDVAARGLDVDNLSHIINYNLPDELEIYTHRSGRTGRAGRTGTSIVIANMREKKKIKDIERLLNKNFELKEIPSGRAICEKQLYHLIDRMEKVVVDYSEIESFLPNIFKKLEWLDREELIKKFVSLEFNRFLAYYKNTKELNAPSDKQSRDRQSREKQPRLDSSEYSRFFINLGKRDNIKPVNIIGMVNDFTGIRDINIGEIEILNNFSFFETDRKYEDDVLKSFRNKERNGREINVEVSEKKKSSKRKKDKSKKKKQTGTNAAPPKKLLRKRRR